MEPTKLQDLERHAQNWDALASEQDRWAVYEESLGRFGGVHRNKAETYRRTAESIRLEAKTGKFHCVCCLKPQTGKVHR